MSQPWGKAGPAGFDFASHLNQLCFILVGGCHPPRPTQFGVRSGVRCTIVFLDGPNPGEELYSVLLWGQRIVARLRNCTGQILLHRLVEGQGTGANKPNDLADPTPADEQMALGWVNFYPGRIDQLLADAMQDFDVQERALLAQERQSQGGAARPQAAQPQPQHAQPTPQWQLNNQHQPVQQQPQYAQHPAQQPQYAQTPTQPQYQQPQYAQQQPPAPPGWAQQPPSAAPAPTQAVYNGPPPQQPQQPAPPLQQPVQQGPPWQSAVVPGGVPATPEQARY